MPPKKEEIAPRRSTRTKKTSQTEDPSPTTLKRKAAVKRKPVEPKEHVQEPQETKPKRGRPKKEAEPKDANPLFLVIGDPHFKTSNVAEMCEMTRATLDLIDERKPDFVVCLGDVLDTHSRIDQVPLANAIEWLYQIQSRLPLIVIVGNHDRMSDEDFLTTQHPFGALKYWNNTLVVDQGALVTYKEWTFACVPYVFRGRFKEALWHLSQNPLEKKEIGPLHAQILTQFDEDAFDPEADIDDFVRPCHCIFAHQEFFGAKMGPFVSQHGDPWPETYPLVLSGHIHDHDWLASNLCYIGTPLQHAFGDKDDKTVSFFYGLETPRNNIWFEEERVELGMKKRLRKITHASDFETADPPKNIDRLVFSWQVRGTRAELAALRTTQKWKDWKPFISEKVLRDDPISLPLPSDKTNKRTHATLEKPFMQMLEEESLGLGEGVSEAYHLLFGKEGWTAQT